MTSAEADDLIASLPKPGGLQLFREGDMIVMAGGKWRSHSISVKASDAPRLITHWKGYVENQGLSLGPDYGKAEKPRPATEVGSDYQPDDPVSFVSPSYPGGWRPGVVVRATPKRVLISFYYKGQYDRHGRLKPGMQLQETWRKRSEVKPRRVVHLGGRKL